MKNSRPGKLVVFGSIQKYWGKIDSKNVLLMAILGLATGFRLWGLSKRDIWYDEALDIIQSEKSLIQIAHDVQTPLHYFFVHFFLYFGKSTFILGLPSVLFGVATVYILYLIGKKFFNNRVGLLASLLASISPMYIEFSRQILHYSYFNFFTVFGLYYFLDFLVGVKNNKFVRSLVLFILVTALNLITHPSAFLVLAMEGSFAILYLLIGGGIKKIFNRYSLFIIILCAIGGLIIFKLGNSGYLRTLADISINISKPMKVGYSLSGYLGGDLLLFNETFLYAMFSWFGIGPGIRFYVYFGLGLLGLGHLFKKKDRTLAYLSLYWLTFPFVFLYLFKISHWFEEKYFFFIIPVYLLLIVDGITYLATSLTIVLNTIRNFQHRSTEFNTRFILFLEIFISTCLLLLSIYPNNQRTIYGFHRDDDPRYSWNQAITYLKTIMRTGDRIIMRNGEGIFFDYYFPKSDKNTVWFEENWILSLSSDNYLQLVNSKSDIYYASIPDFNDLFLASITDASFLSKKGGFNIYKIQFHKKSPFVVTRDNAGNWQYYDDFRTAKYISDSAQRTNLNSTYSGNYNVPVTYGYYNLSPVENSESSIDYHFVIPARSSKIAINPKFSLAKNASIKIFIGNSISNEHLIYTQTADNFSYYSPVIPWLPSILESDVYLRIEFSHATSNDLLKQIALKSILITNKDILSGYHFSKSEDEKYTYSSELELTRSNKWLFDTTTNKGWDQSLDGVLFDFWGDPSQTPLIYKFLFDTMVRAEVLKIKTYTFNNNPISILMSSDGRIWKEIDGFNDNKVDTKEYEINLPSDSNIYFMKVLCKYGGPTCQLRDFTLTFSGPSK